MADSRTSALTDSQQEALATYTSLTNQDPETALPLLQRSQWNVQIAVTKFFDGEGPDPLTEAMAAEAAAPAPQRTGQRGVLLDEMDYATLQYTQRSQRDAAPRIVPQSADRQVWKPPLPFALILIPVNILWKLVSSSFSLIGWAFPFLPRLLQRLSNRSQRARSAAIERRALNVRDTTARFIREFGEEYGDHRLPFFEDGYAQAYDVAKRDLKFLLVVILSPEHDNTSVFVREVLLSQEVQDFVSEPANNLVLWTGNVQDSEAYQVACGLSCTKFPFAALIAHTPQDSSTAMSTVARIVGLTTADEFINKLRTAISQHGPSLERTRAQRREQEATRNLRQQQESAYERSLAQDRERTRLRKEAEAAKQKEEAEARARADQAEKAVQQSLQWKKWRASILAAEPGTDVMNATRLSIRMLSGERIVRRFLPQASIEEVYALVECYDVLDDCANTAKPADYKHEYKFRLVSPMPRQVYELEDGGTVGEKIGRSGNLIVESTELTEDED